MEILKDARDTKLHIVNFITILALVQLLFSPFLMVFQFQLRLLYIQIIVLAIALNRASYFISYIPTTHKYDVQG